VAIAAVQRKIKGAVGASVSIGAGDGWAGPAAGNLLVFSANSDALVTLSGAGTVSNGPSIIDGNGAYTWYKFATGSETTITGTPSVSDDIVLTACEYSGVAAFDVSNSSTIASTAGTTTTAAAVTTTAAADLIVAFALTHGFTAGGNPTGASWSNSFVNVLSGDTGTTSAVGQRCASFAGELLPAGAAGSYSTACTWTNTASDRQHIILAFTAAAGGGAPAFAPPFRSQQSFF
jgi:hypothetical protein